MNRPYHISVGCLVAVLVVTGWLGLGTLLLSILFSYFAISKLDFLKPRGKWLAILIFLVLLAGVAYALGYFIQATVAALPAIAEKALPAVTQWAAEHHIALPFTDLESLRDQIINSVRSEASSLGKFADFARGATTEFVFLTIGCMVAMGLFLNPRLDEAPPSSLHGHDLYSLTCHEIGRRFSTFYESFAITMNAQVIISAINTALTGIFMASLGLPHLGVALGVTFICGMVPVVGNIISSIIVIAIGFVVSPAKGLWAVGFECVNHYLGFLIGSKIIGDKIHLTFWLTLVALVVGESLMGVTGLVLAPVVLHYIRIEASQIRVGHKSE